MHIVRSRKIIYINIHTDTQKYASFMHPKHHHKYNTISNNEICNLQFNFV